MNSSGSNRCGWQKYLFRSSASAAAAAALRDPCSRFAEMNSAARSGVCIDVDLPCFTRERRRSRVRNLQRSRGPEIKMCVRKPCDAARLHLSPCTRCYQQYDDYSHDCFSTALLLCQLCAKFLPVPAPKIGAIVVRIAFAFTISCDGKLVAAVVATLLNVL